MKPAYLEDKRMEHFNLREAPGEKSNLAHQQPDMAKQLPTRLHPWRDEVRAAWPALNPNFKAKPKAPR